MDTAQRDKLLIICGSDISYFEMTHFYKFIFSLHTFKNVYQFYDFYFMIALEQRQYKKDSG